MEATEENKQQSYEIVAQNKKSRCSVVCYCLCLLPVFFYTGFMGLFSFNPKEIFTQILTDGEKEYEFKGSLTSPSYDIYINFTSYAHLEMNQSLILNEKRHFEVTCLTNQSYSDCYDNCIGECEFFNDWFNFGWIFRIGIMPPFFTMLFTMIILYMICACNDKTKVLLISIASYILIIISINYIVTFIIWAIKIDLKENDVHHNVFISRTASVKRGTGLNIIIIFISTIPLMLAYFFYIFWKIKSLIKLKADIAVLPHITTLEQDYRPEINNIVSNEVTTPNLNYFNNSQPISEHLLEDYASSKKINNSTSTSFNES